MAFSRKTGNFFSLFKILPMSAFGVCLGLLFYEANFF